MTVTPLPQKEDTSISALSVHALRFRMRSRFLNDLKKRPLIMGVLNITPDSFSDGGQFDDEATALIHANSMMKAGVDIIDIGAESTRPGSTPLSAEAELSRLKTILPKIVAKANCPLSIDSYKADVARYAVEQGVSVINDVSGFKRDPDMLRVIAETQAVAIAMHRLEEEDDNIDIIESIAHFVDDIAVKIRKMGIEEERIIIDPGIGFGTSRAQDYEIIQKIELLKSFGFPILIGLSRKRMIGAITGRGVDDRLAGTLSANMIALQNGADIIRVHDVAEHKDILAVFQTLVAS